MGRFEPFIAAAGLVFIVAAPFAAWQAQVSRFHDGVVTGAPLMAIGLLILGLSRTMRK